MDEPQNPSERVSLTFLIRAEDRTTIKEWGKARGLSLSDVCREAVRRFILQVAQKGGTTTPFTPRCAVECEATQTE